MKKCYLCPRECGIERDTKSGFCGEKSALRVCRAAKHFWEEPNISGKGGAGAIFFSGCSLRCIYCQNSEISGGESGKTLSPTELADIMLRLESDGAENIDLVTPTHFTDLIALALVEAKNRGLSVPIVWNSSGYEKVETLKTLEGLVDVYLPDFKYYDAATAAKYSSAPDYAPVALGAIAEMLRQVGKPCVADGILKRGVMVRHLLLPGCVIQSKMALAKLYGHFKDDVLYSVMSQYTPCKEGLPDSLSRTVTASEYHSLTAYAEKLGIKNGYFQDISSVGTGFVPKFDGTGVYL